MNLVKSLETELASLRSKLMEANDECDQLRVQLAGCLTAAEGATKDPALQGQWGWSVAYQATLDLRLAHDVLEEQLTAAREAMAEIAKLAEDSLKNSLHWPINRQADEVCARIRSLATAALGEKADNG